VPKLLLLDEMQPGATAAMVGLPMGQNDIGHFTVAAAEPFEKRRELRLMRRRACVDHD
jgi:hypothetical protein